MIIGFVIWSICAVIFLVIGISTGKSKEPAGFFTFRQSPVVRDVGRYNPAVAILWMVSAFLLELLGVPILFAEQNSPVFIIPVLGTLILIIGMIIAYIRIEAKYRG